MKIVIVDDNADYRALLREVFGERGWEALAAPDGESCLRLLHQHVPDVILSDIMMPRMDGFQLLRAVRNSPFSDVIFIFYSSTYEKPEHREFAVSLGADGYIIKPPHPEELVTALSTVVEGNRPGAERKKRLAEEEFLRKHNLLLSEKLLEKTALLRKEEADRQGKETGHHRVRHHRAGHGAAPAVPIVPVQCPFTVSNNVYNPVVRIDKICEELSRRKSEVVDTGAAMLLDQLCMAMRRLRQHVRDLQEYIIIPRSELYAPMRRIQILIEVLKKDYTSLPTWVGAGIADVETHVRHFASLVEDLVKLTTVAKADLNVQPLDMTMHARSLVEDLQKAFPDRQVEVMIQEGMQVNADRKLMHVALEHLIENAWKFTREVPAARIEVDMILVDQKRVFFVRDNGVGFENYKADRLFTAFQKLHPEGQFPGNGIGLAIVKMVICRHGGSVWATGEPGRGATFYFTVGG